MATGRMQYVFDILKGKNTLGPEFDKLSKQSRALQDNIARVTKVSGAAFVGLTAVIGGTVAAASKFEDIGVQFEVLTGNIHIATKAMNDLKELSAKTPFQFEDIARAGKQLLAFGYSVDQLRPKLTQIGNVAAASGAQLNEVALIFGQVAAAGKLTGERLLQFQERAIPIGPAIAKTMGVAESAVKDLVSKGKVNLKIFEKAFASLSKEGGFAFNGMEKLSRTLTGRISTLKDNFSLFASEIGENFLPAAKAVVLRMTELIGWFRENPDIAKAAAAFLAVSASLTGIVTVAGLGFLALVKLKLALVAAAVAAGGLGAALKLALISSGVGIAIVALGVGVAYLATNWDKSVKTMKAVWEGFSNFFKDASAWVVAQFELAMAKIPLIMDKTVEKLRALWQHYVDFFKDAGILIKDVIFGIAKFDMSAVKKSVDNFGMAVDKNMTRTEMAMTKAENKYLELKKTLEEGIKIPDVSLKFNLPDSYGADRITAAKKRAEEQASLSQGPKAKSSGPDLDRLGDLSKMATSVMTGIKAGSAGLVKGISTAVGIAFGPIGNMIAGMVNGLIDFFGQAPAEFAKMFTKAIGELPQLIGDIVVNLIGVITGEALEKGITAFIDNLPSLIERLVEAGIKFLFSPVFWTRVAGAAIGAFIKMIPRIIPAIIRGFKGALGNIGKIFSSDILKGAGKFVEKIIDGAGQFVKELLKKIGSAIGGKSGIGGSSIFGGLSGSIIGGIVMGPAGSAAGAAKSIAETVGKVLGFAEGGQIPSGFPNDTFPARLTSGEFVIDRSQNKKLGKYLANQERSQSDGTIVDLLSAMLDKLNQPQTANASVQLNTREFANILLELNRGNARVTA